MSAASLSSNAAGPCIVESMRDYYARRAATYERVYSKPERQADLRVIEKWLTPQFSGRRVLEIACGTGWWTVHGAHDCAAWLATDLNPETLALAQEKPLPPGRVRFATVDAYTLAGLDESDGGAASYGAAASGGAASFDAVASGGAASFDAAFAGCWWSHVPLAHLPAWLALLHRRLEPGARVVFLDNRFVQSSSTPISRRDADGNTYQQRCLDDGSTHEVLKNFPTRDDAVRMLGDRGRTGARDPQWIEFEHYWVLSYTLA